jgi:hypothetical protein
MGRIHVVNGRKLHVGGRLIPQFAHGLLLHSPRYGLNLAKWPTPPASTSWGDAPAAQPVLTNILGNDTVGDCTEADQYHRQAIRQAAAGSPVFPVTTWDVLVTYSRDTGYDPNDPSTDQGADETVVLQNAINQGITSDASGGVAMSTGYIAIDGTNVDLITKVISVFPGGTPICGCLPQSWIDAVKGPGFDWGTPTDPFVPANGHCWTLSHYNTKRACIWTWGIPGLMTWDALALVTETGNGGALYLEVNAEVLNAASQLAPDGLDWATLIDDFDSLGGTVAPPPAPAPPAPPAPPVPQPVPPQAVALTIDQVQAILTNNWPSI